MSASLGSDSSRTNTSSDTENDDEENHHVTPDAAQNAATRHLGCFICLNENDPIGIKKSFYEEAPYSS